MGVALVCLAGVGFAWFAAMSTGADDAVGSSPPASLAEAVASGDLDGAVTLIEAGADPDEPRSQGFTPLMRAAIRDDAPMAQLLLDAGADLNATELGGLTALHVAAEADSTAALDVLIAAGADPEDRSTNGMNALEHAASAGSVDVIEAIAATEVDLDARSAIVTGGHGYPRDTGSTALGIAARAGHLDAVVELLELGADVDASSETGHTPLLLAIFSGQSPELVSVLLAAGADPTATATCDAGCSHDDGDAIEWARRLGHDDLIPLLESARDD